MDFIRKSALNKLEKRIGYGFKDLTLLNIALTHTSYVKGDAMAPVHNERLEYLGDAVLELGVSEYIFKNFAHLSEGSMTRIRAQAVCEEALSEAAMELDIGSLLLLGHGEANSGGRHKPSILSDALEAIIGALYIDGGMDAARPFILGFVEGSIRSASDGRENKDSKTMLQEYVQKCRMGKIEYELTAASGPDHDKVFRMSVSVGGATLGSGEGRTKQEAGQQAARAALDALKND